MQPIDQVRNRLVSSRRRYHKKNSITFYPNVKLYESVLLVILEVSGIRKLCLTGVSHLSSQVFRIIKPKSSVRVLKHENLLSFPESSAIEKYYA